MHILRVVTLSLKLLRLCIFFILGKVFKVSRLRRRHVAWFCRGSCKLSRAYLHVLNVSNLVRMPLAIDVFLVKAN